MSVSEQFTTGLANVRDLGGLPVTTGGTTRHGVLYRSDAPRLGDAPPADMAWPPVVIIDLRDPDELRGLEHPLLATTDVVHSIPLHERDRMAQLHALDGPRPELAELYQQILDTAGARLAQITHHASAATGPVLIHCAAGKDRTGITVAVLLAVAGVRREAIVADYVRTEDHLPALIERLDSQLLPPSWQDSSDLSGLMRAPAAAIEGVLDRLEEYDDGVLGWLRSNGADAAVGESWRQRITEPA